MKTEEIQGEIKWISGYNKGRNGDYYRIVTFKMIGGDTKTQPKVYISNDCRNLKNWTPLLQEGNVLGGLLWLDKTKATIDADSPIYLI